MTVIHFLDLEDLLPELDPIAKVRINQLVIIVQVYVDPSMNLEQVGVHVRQVNSDNHVLSWMLATGEYETYRGDPHLDKDEKAKHLALHEAAVIKEMVEERIESLYPDIVIRPGIIDLGRSGPIMGHWSLLEVTREEVEVQPEETNTQEDDGDEIPF